MAISTENHKAVQGFSVLLVDDETALLDVMTTSLQDAGYSCLAAASAANALDLLGEHGSVNVIISDVRMPGASGLEFLQTVRSQFGERGWLQTLFITGHPSLDNAVEAIRLEAVDFLSKPIKRVDLLSAVHKANERAMRHRMMMDAVDRKRAQLDDLIKESDLIASLIGGGAAYASTPSGLGAAVPPAEKSVGKGAAPQAGQLPLSRHRVLELLRFRELRPRFFKDRLFSDPVWQMLLDLMENNLLEKEVSVSSLYIASGVPISTASRRLDDLEEAGLVTRWDDPKDGRRQYVRVTEKAEKLITGYLVSLDNLLGEPRK